MILWTLYCDWTTEHRSVFIINSIIFIIYFNLTDKRFKQIINIFEAKSLFWSLIIL